MATLSNIVEGARKCPACKLHHNPRIVCSVARRLHASGRLPQPSDAVLSAIVNTTLPTMSDVNTDRHSDGYMKVYMAKYRAKRKAEKMESNGKKESKP